VRWLATFIAWLALLITRTAVLAAISALAAATAAMTTMTLIVIAPGFIARATLSRARRNFRFAAEKSLQPADKSSGFFLRLGTRCTVLIRLVGARLELAIVPTRFTRFVAPRAAATRLVAFVSRIPRLTWLTGFERPAFTRITALARWLKCPPFVLTLGRLLRRLIARRSGCHTGGFPPEGRPFGIFWRQDVQLGFG
jgi:hypothetical protein